MTRDVIVTARLRVRARSFDKMHAVLDRVRLTGGGLGWSATIGRWQLEVVVPPTFEIVQAPKKAKRR